MADEPDLHDAVVHMLQRQQTLEDATREALQSLFQQSHSQSTSILAMKIIQHALISTHPAPGALAEKLQLLAAAMQPMVTENMSLEFNRQLDEACNVAAEYAALRA